MARGLSDGLLRFCNGAWRDNDGDAVDIVDVVRCKDCILYKPNYLPGLHKNDNCGICDRYPFLSGDHKFWTKTDFCSYGERKDKWLTEKS